jgi:hypothetical protein
MVMVEHYHRSEALDETGVVQQTDQPPRRFASVFAVPSIGAVPVPAGAFAPIAVPVGAKAVRLLPGRAPSLRLAGSETDGGISLTTGRFPIGSDCFLPLGDSPTLGIRNNGPELVWVGYVFV